jgi:drug/metabolite transporter (DMT)-like permease
MIFPALSEQRKGLLLTAIGGLALSFDIPLIRLSEGDPWSILATRSIITFAMSFVYWWIACRMTGKRVTLVGGWIGLLVGLLYTLGTVAFLIAVYHTRTANLVFILAFNPMIGAIFGWIFLKQRPAVATLITMLVMIGGVGIIVHDGMASGYLLGDSLALLCAVSLAAAITISSASKADLGFAPMVSNIFPAIVGMVLVAKTGFVLESPGWIIFNALFVTPLAFWCLATGPRYLSPPVVGMFYLLETVLAPIWVWLIFSETPTVPTLIGGTILIVALIAHSLWMMRKERSA